jgi:hypothetical protein
MAVRLSASCAGCPIPPRIFQVIISVTGLVNPGTILLQFFSVLPMLQEVKGSMSKQKKKKRQQPVIKPR